MLDNLKSKVDELGALKAAIADLQDAEKKLKTEIAAGSLPRLARIS